MRPNKSLLLAAVLGASVLLATCSASNASIDAIPQATKTTQSSVSTILERHTPPTKADFRQAIKVVSTALSKHPNNDALLRRRAKLYIHIHQYERAVTDLQHAQDSAPLSPTLDLGLCMLLDRVHGYSRKVKRCYTRVTGRFASDHKPGTPPTINYVAAAIMADSPNASRLKDAFLAANKPTTPLYDLMKQFDREKYVHTVFP